METTSWRASPRTLLSASGAVANATVLQPGGVVTLQGCSMIVSLSGTVFSLPSSADLSVLVSYGNGQVLGGSVVGPLVAAAAGLVVLTAMSFERVEYVSLPLVEEDPSAASSSQSSSPVISAGGDGGGGVFNLASGNARSATTA